MMLSISISMVIFVTYRLYVYNGPISLSDHNNAPTRQRIIPIYSEV